MTAPTDPPSARPDLTPFGRVSDALRKAVANEPDADAREAVDELFPTGKAQSEFVRRFAMLIMLSSSIAAFGLLADSAAVVIGAMLVAPLMTPILATAAATVMARNRELVIALGVIALGTLLAIGVGWVMSAIAADAIAGTDLPTEVSARTFPGLLDLGIAVTAGAAAGYILPRRSATSALPGVGIAVALVPPLATVGITWQLGETADAENALLLYLTNLAAIVFAASIMLVFDGFRPKQQISRRALTGRVMVTLAAVVVVAVPLTLHTQSTIEDSRLQRDVTDAVAEWDPSARIVTLRADATDSRATVELLVSGPNDPSEVWLLAETISRRYGGPVDLEMQYEKANRFLVSTR